MKFAVVLLCVALAVPALAKEDGWHRAKIHERMEQHSACEGDGCAAGGDRAGDNAVMVHPADESGYNSTGEYTGQNLPKAENPKKACCFVCPSTCGESHDRGCFKKCYRACGELCRVEAYAEEDECTIGENCGLVEAKPTGCDASPEPEPAAAATGVQGHVVAVEEPEIKSSATGMEKLCEDEGCEEPEVITEEDVESVDAPAAVSAEPQPNDPRDPDYQNSALEHRDEDQVTKAKQEQERATQRKLRHAQDVQRALQAAAEHERLCSAEEADC